MSNGIQQYTQLEQRLVLLSLLNSLPGYASNRETLADARNVVRGFNAAGGRRFLYYHLR